MQAVMEVLDGAADWGAKAFILLYSIHYYREQHLYFIQIQRT